VPDPTVYTLTVYRLRDTVTFQARAEWGSPERQVTGAPGADELQAVANAVEAMREADREGNKS
jgi:hypothetical protein